MATYKRKQADSLWVDLTASAVAETTIDTIDSIWDNWSGVFTVAKKVGGTPLVTGNLLRSATKGIFRLRIGKTTGVSWTALPPGTYALTCEIQNITVDYSQELQDTLIISAQGA